MSKKKKTKISKLNILNKIGIEKELEYFLENLSILFATGMDIIFALESVRSGMRIPQMRKAIDDVASQVKEGVSLWRAFERINLLPGSVISLLRIGEESGRLAENLEVIVAQQQKDRSFRSRLRSAMMYPLLILSMTLFVGLGISWFILPKLSKVFTSLNLELPFLTKLLIDFGMFLQQYGIIAVPIFLLVLGVLIYFIFVFPLTKFIGQTILFNLPVIKTLLIQIELSRFGFIFSTLLGSGIPMSVAMNSLKDSTSFIRYKRFYGVLQRRIEEGDSFKIVFQEYKKLNKLFPYFIQQMIVAAEQSGQLVKTLKKVAEIYEEKMEVTTKNLSVLLEPLMLFIVFGGVIILAMAVITPIYGLLSGINKPSTPAPAPSVQKEPTPVPKDSSQLDSYFVQDLKLINFEV